MGCLLDDRSDEQYQRDYEAWWAERGWIYDLLTGIALIVLLISLLLIAGAFR